MNGKEMEFINEAIRDNEISYYGKNIDQFKKSLEDFIQKKDRLALLNSGTSAIHLALVLSGVSYGDEVICQSFTFCASANPIKYLGANPIFVDSEIDTFNICPVFLEMAIKARIAKGKKPKAIVFVNGYGMPAKIDKIKEIANLYNIVLIEDSASALGSQYKSKKCGTFGDYSIFSFNGNKIINTSGGGALVCKSNKEREEVLSLSNQAKEKYLYYEHSKIGYNYRMSNLNAGMGRAQFQSLEALIKKKREINAYYKKNLNIQGVTIISEPSSDYFCNFWLTNILIDEKVCGFDNNFLQSTLDKQNVETRFLWKPMHLQPIYKNQPYYGTNISENLFKTGLSLPSSMSLTKKELSKIINIIKEINNYK